MSTVKEDDDRLVFIREEDLDTPPEGLIEHFKDYWWLVHPEKGLVFFNPKRKSPQANKNEAVARAIAKNLYPWAEVKQIPSVFRKIDPRNYA